MLRRRLNVSHSVIINCAMRLFSPLTLYVILQMPLNVHRGFTMKLSRSYLSSVAVVTCLLVLAGTSPVHAETPAVKAPADRLITTVSYHTVDIDGVKVFYREAGSKSAPKLLLLHGFPYLVSYVQRPNPKAC